MPRLSIGDIYWIDHFPAHSGGNEKRRPVVVIDVIDELLVTVVGISTDPSDGVEIPNTTDEPGAATGLPERSWAVVAWLVNVYQHKLLDANYAGYLPQVTLAKLIYEVDQALSQWGEDDPS